MLVVGFPTGAFQANCYLIAPGEGEPCVIVASGARYRKLALPNLEQLLTHGHFDHMLSVAPICDGNDIPAWIHPSDRELLADPLKGLSRDAIAFFGGRIEVREPAEVRELADGTVLELAGLTITVDHTPGHTRGSVIFRSDLEEGGRLVFSGDTLFAGSIGRTDLPGGDLRTILESLRGKLLTLDDETVVLPGHGGSTTIGRERASNPFLTGLQPFPARRGL